MMTTPLLSIIIPAYNEEQYIEQTLRSIMEQHFHNWECIVVDDGSTDNTVQIAKNLTYGYERFRICKLERNMGLPYARNYGMLKAKGKYLMFFDSDDILEPNYTKNAVNMMEDSPELTMYYGRVIKFLPSRSWVEGAQKWIDYAHYLNNGTIYIPAIIRRNRAVEVGGFDESMRTGLEDREFFTRYLYHYDRIFESDNISFYYRQRNGMRVALRATVMKVREYIYNKHKSKFREFGTTMNYTL